MEKPHLHIVHETILMIGVSLYHAILDISKKLDQYYICKEK